MDELARDRAFKALVIASCAVFGTYVYRGLRTPEPGADQEVAADLSVERHVFTTDDGVELAVKRYANPRGTPVLFCHGFDGNGFEFDLPRQGKNMAVYLARRGYDVWISSFRGCGVEPFISRCDWQHSIDTLAVMDAPALVEGVTGVTGKRPFWIGHSMGGMVLYMYLQGVRFEGEHRVVSDPELVERRNRSLAGGIAIASPPAFWWPRFHPFHIATESSIGRGILGLAILQMRARGKLFPHVRVGKGLKALVFNRPRAIKALSRSPLGILLYCRRNTDSETTTSLVKWAGDDVSARMFIQLMDGIWNLNFRQYFPLTYREEPYDYTMNMHLITLPMLFITGEKDFASYQAIRRYGYDRISSAKKDFMTFPGYGHTDLVMGKTVEQEVYPVVADWIARVEAGSP